MAREWRSAVAGLCCAVVASVLAPTAAGAAPPPTVSPPRTAITQPATALPATGEPPAAPNLPEPAAGAALASTTGQAGKAAAASDEDEVAARRTETSRTFETPTGELRTVLSQSALNFTDSKGVWQPIDDRLVPDAGAGFAWRNAADSYSVQLPADLSTGPVRLTQGGAWVAFRLKGARSVVGTVEGNQITYAGVLPGVDLTYSAQPDGLKETLVLANADAASSFAFDVTTSPGLVASKDGGKVRLTGAGNKLAMLLTAPWAQDSSADVTGFAGATNLTLSGSLASGLVATLSVAPAWLKDAKRVWPVTVDPTISPGGTAITDCHLVSGLATTNYCGSTNREAGYGADGGKIRRTLLKFDTSALPADAQVLDAELSMYVTQTFQSTNPVPLQVRRVGAIWNTAATWNTTDGAAAWPINNPGGNPSQNAYFTVPAGGTATGYVRAGFTDLVQGWAGGTYVNTGVVLRAADETKPGVVRFNSSKAAANRPFVDVTWTRIAGQHPTATYLSNPLSGHSNLGVNPATGDVLLSTQELKVAGTNLDVELGHTYNSRVALDVGDANAGKMSRGWDTSLGDALRLQRYDNAVALYLPGGAVLPFTRDSATAAWKAPSGLDAKLTLTGSGAAGTVLFRSNGLSYGFSDGSPASTGLLTSIKTKNGNTITVVHQGGTGAVGRVSDTQGRNFSYGYDTSGRLASITDGAGNRSLSYGYDSSGRLASYTDVNGATTSYGYDSSNRLSKVTSPEGRITDIGYDSQSRVASISRYGTTCTAVNVTATTSYAYAAPDSGAPAAGSDLFARTVGMTTVTNAEGKATKYYTDTLRRVGRVVDALGRKRDVEFDPTTGNVNAQLDNLGQATRTTYAPGSSNISSVQGPAEADGTKAVTSFGDYQGSDQPLAGTVTDPSGNTTTFGFTPDKTNRTSATRPSGAVAKVSYNSNGTLASATTEKGGVRSFGYDANGNLTKVIYPSGGSRLPTTITRDGISRPRVVTDGRGKATTTTFDKLDRVVRVDYYDGSWVGFTYDKDDNLTARRDRNGGSAAMSYDKMNRPVSVFDPASGQTSKPCFDKVGNLTSLQEGGSTGTTSYSYDATGAVTQVVEPGGSCPADATAAPAADSGCIRVRYNNAGKVDRTTYPGGVKTEFGYFNSGKPKTVKTSTAAGAVITSRTSSYLRTVGGVQKATNQLSSTVDEQNRTASYSYTVDGQLKTATGVPAGPSAVHDYDYGYDSAGNPTRVSIDGATSRTMAYAGTSDELASSNGLQAATGYGYDAAGNLTSSTAGYTATADAANVTTSMTDPTGGNSLSATYAGTGQNQRSTTSTGGPYGGTATATYSPLGLMGVSGTGRFTRLPDGGLLGMRPDNDKTHNRYYLTDHLGSTIAMIGADGSSTKLAAYAYEPYGRTTYTSGAAAASNPYRYGQGYTDSTTGLIKLGIRYYDPTLGRFTHPDPTSQDRDYTYAGSDPCNNTDPTGASAGCISSVVGVVVGVAGIPFSVGSSAALALTAVGIGASGVGVATGCSGGGYPRTPANTRDSAGCYIDSANGSRVCL